MDPRALPLMVVSFLAVLGINAWLNGRAARMEVRRERKR
jgi:hypothetical protein